jgi:hypothetical protein
VQNKKDTIRVNGVKTNGTTGNDEVDSPEAGQNVHSGGAVDPQQRREVLIQSLFDIFVLQLSLDIGSSTEDELQALANTVESRIELESSARKRLHNAAKEYWKRTGLLFGLLG